MITDLEAKKAFKMLFLYSNPLIYEDEYWDYQINLFEKDYGFKTKWEEFKPLFKEEFNNDFELFNGEYNYVKEKLKNLIDFTEDNHEMPKFPETMKELYKISHPFKNGHYYISIDITKAYSKAIDSLSLFNKPWEEIKNGLTNSKILRDSKKLRVSSYPSKDINIFLKRICYQILSELYNSDTDIINLIKKEKLEFAKYITDELTWDITGKEDVFKSYDKKTFIFNGIEFHISIFKCNRIYYKLGDNKKVILYRSYLDNHCKLSVDILTNLVIPQLLKVINNKKITQKDLAIPNGLTHSFVKGKITTITEEEYQSI